MMSVVISSGRRLASMAARVAGAVTPMRGIWAGLIVIPLVFLTVGMQGAGVSTPGTAPEPMPALDEAIAPVAAPPQINLEKWFLGERLFNDVRLSGGNTHSCSSCHDLGTNGARGSQSPPSSTPPPALDTLTVFNAALNFRLTWEGRFRTLESQAEASINAPQVMGGSVEAAVAKLAADAQMAGEFRTAYGVGPTRETLLDALATFERSLLTPNARFDLWLEGNRDALSATEQEGYRLFKSLGCIACHQGRNVGGNLFQRHGIFRPLASPEPALLRVPSLRNVATTAPYFHDGSAPTLAIAVRRMADAQLNVTLEQGEIDAIVAFLGSLTGRYRGKLVHAGSGQ